jgi:hypothetical protein
MRVKWVILVAGLALLAALGWLGAPFRYYPHERPGAVAARIRDGLPVGSDKSVVLAYLKRSGIENSGYLPDKRKIYAIRRDTCVALFVSCSVDMILSFSDSGTLLAISIAEGLTGV